MFTARLPTSWLFNKSGPEYTYKMIQIKSTINRLIVCLIVITGISVFPAKSQIDSLYAVTDTINDDIILFDKDDPLEITLKFDITHYRRKRHEDEYLDALLTYHLSPDDSIVKELRVRPRGISRRSICSFPPLKLNFRKSDTTGKEFGNIDKIKMVTHCMSGGKEYVLKEYLVYKLFNILTDYSYRVRLLRVTYIDTYKERKPIREFAFLIEPDETLIKRLDSGDETTAYMTQKHIKPEIMDRMAIFNYMIGNTDWSVPVRHNVFVLAGNNPSVIGSGVAIPYDFDYAGLVNTHYAVPFEGLELKSVLERRYMGVCRSEEVFAEALEEFFDKKDELIKTINEFTYLKPKTKKEMVKYLDSFFREFDKRNTIVSLISRDCINF